jgi:ATP-dependent helicase/nuclease subunit B
MPRRYPFLMLSRHAIICSPRAADRLTAAARWLEALEPHAEVMVLAARQPAADDLVRALSARRALFGVHRMTPARLLGVLCAERLFRDGRAPAAGLGVEAVAARAIAKLAAAGVLGYFAPVADRPGFPGALARTLGEVRLAGIRGDELAALEEIGAPLAALLGQYEAELHDARLVDRAAMFALAVAMVKADPPPHQAAMPILMLDVAVASTLERDLYAALAVRSPAMLATVPQGDLTTLAMLGAALGAAPAPAPRAAATAESIARLQDYLFSDETPPQRLLDDSVEVASAPGEMQECVEIARRVLAEADRGVAFDRIAIALHAPGRYVPYLEEALDRAAIPACFARGATRPEPGGRALLALLACAAEHLSARRYAEYLSLAQVPDPARDGFQRFVAPDLELAGTAPAAEPSQGATPATVADAGLFDLDDPVPVVEGALRAPWRWERLLVDAAVIGSRERWARRLSGLRAELKLKRSELADDDGRAAFLDRQIVDLGHLSDVAMPQISALAALPRQATWGEWLSHLRALTALAVRDPAPVAAALAELEPMAPVGPVTLDEVRQVLAERLGRLEAPAPRRRYGAVMVAPAQDLRGLDFDVVMVPGLTERVFPKKLTEDAILPDAARVRLGHGLELQHNRAAAERLALRLAAGAARQRVLFSFPRVDLDQGRPRVPSFYALEVLRAAEGRLPGFDELDKRAAGEQAARLGWPAPRDAADAIDDAEFDLAVLNRLAGKDDEATTGAAHYLLDQNPHLARALRARARRWLKRWTPADGLVDPGPEVRAVLDRHRPDARSYSATALQHFAACPYRFLLYAIHRIQPREEVEAIEVIDPLTRGALLHEVQFELLTRLRAAARLPVSRATLEGALGTMDRTLEEVAAKWHDRLAPAIERVWRDAIDAIRGDLREWLRRAAEDPVPWTPERFELAFGLDGRDQADPASRAEPVALEAGLILRGSIDLVERGLGGRLRVTDHKSGKADAPREVIIGGGRVLQPVLYALAAERLLGEPVESGRLYYCSSRGGYEERVVPLDEAARGAAREFAATVADAVAQGFLPAAPANGGCRWCDYRMVCGPYEEARVALKPAARLAALERLRSVR